MKFERYEIRWFTREDGEMTYMPFDSLAEANAYIDTHIDECSSTETIDCGLYKIILHSSFEETEQLRRL